MSSSFTIVLERHAYAPEMNTAHIYRRGVRVASLRAPGATSIRAARRTLFAQARPGLRVAIWSRYDEPRWRWLDALKAEGRTASRLEAWRLARQFRTAPATLDDGAILPGNRVELRFAY